jgi:uncharacterized protein (DUF849 family)
MASTQTSIVGGAFPGRSPRTTLRARRHGAGSFGRASTVVSTSDRRSPLLEVALNGARSRAEHGAVPRTPAELGRAAKASTAAGARVVHLHVYDDDAETFAAQPCAATLRAVRAACPGVPVSLTTSAGVEPDPARRMELIREWTGLPDLVTANMGEPGIIELCDLLAGRGVGIEAGLLSTHDAEVFVRSGVASRCARVLIEPLDPAPEDALAHAAEMEDIVEAAGVTLEQVHHGDGIASWAVNERALERGHGIRTGLEDTTELPDGTAAEDNATLVRCASRMIQEVRADR